MSSTKRLHPFRRLFGLLSLDRPDIIQVYGYAFLNGLVTLTLPIGIQAIINLIQGGTVSTAWVVLVSFVLLGTFFTGIFQLMQLRIVESISQKLFTRSAFEFAFRLPSIRNSALRKHHAPELTNRFFDTITIQKALPKILIDFSISLFQIAIGLIVLSFYHSFFIVYGFLLIMGIVAILVVTGPDGLETSLDESKYKYQVAEWLEEIARTRLSFKLIANPQIALQKTDTIVNKYLTARENHFRILVRHFSSLIGFKILITAGLLIIGGILVFEQEMNIGQFVAAEIIIIIVIVSIEKLIQSIDSIYDVLTALEKIGYVTDMEMDNDYGEGLEIDLTANDGISTELVNIYFGYPESGIIHKNISIKKDANESLCIYGPSGSGKSTLMGIWSGLLKPNSGVVLFNGLALDSIKFSSLKKYIGYVFNSNQIFFGTILDNITLSREGISTQDVLDAMKLVLLDGFVKGLPNGLNEVLDPEARRIPKSVLSKILIARAIVNRPKLLMMEDILTAFPVDERELVIQNLTSPSNPWTVLLVTNDLIWTKYISRKATLINGELKEMI